MSGKVRRTLLIVLALLALLFGAYLAGPRIAMGPAVPTERELPPASIQALEPWLQASESRFKDIRPGTAKGIVWAADVGQRTPWAVVYVHGYFASRMETAPLTDQVARSLGANVFYTRLSGHGRSGPAMLEAKPQDWLADVLEAVRIGKTLGDRVLVISCSTGSTLGTWLALSPEGRSVAAQVFISPNFGPKDKRSNLITGPWGAQIALAIEGENRGWDTTDPRELAGWTTRHPTASLFPMMTLVQHVQSLDFSGFKTPVLVLYSERDQVVDPQATQAAFSRFGSSVKNMIPVDYSDNISQHVLAGDIKAPGATARMSESIVQWVKSLPREGT